MLLLFAVPTGFKSGSMTKKPMMTMKATTVTPIKIFNIKNKTSYKLVGGQIDFFPKKVNYLTI